MRPAMISASSFGAHTTTSRLSSLLFTNPRWTSSRCAGRPQFLGRSRFRSGRVRRRASGVLEFRLSHGEQAQSTTWHLPGAANASASDFSALLSNAYRDRRSRRGTRGGLSELRRRDELLTAIDVVRRTSERSVGHDVHSQRSHIGRPDHAANWERGPQLLAPGVEPVTEKIG